jgi:hypothetical protein
MSTKSRFRLADAEDIAGMSVRKIVIAHFKFWWYELLEFIWPDETSNWSDEFKRRYAEYKRKNLRL